MLRNQLRSQYLDTLRRALQTPEGRAMAVDALNGLTSWRPSLPAGVPPAPYDDLGRSRESAPDYTGTVFISARFRTGSTLLWSIFRQIEGCVAYYEPLNERRWFDPAARGDRVDSTHRGVEDYWREYDGLSDLKQWFRDDWNDRALLLEASEWNAGLKHYLDRLIQHAAPSRAVLQCNRIDFRLPWLRQAFPGATFIHLYRHPRDQWCSTLVDPSRVPRDVTMAEFQPFDHFYLRRWAIDLQRHFPFLADNHVSPYRIHYYIWRLLYIYGTTYSDGSIAFEDLVATPEAVIGRLAAMARVDVDASKLASLVSTASIGRWREFADADWFCEHEAACEAVLAEFFRTQPPRSSGAVPA